MKAIETNVYEVVTGGAPITILALNDEDAKHAALTIGLWHYGLKNENGQTILRPTPGHGERDETKKANKIDTEYLDDPEACARVAASLETALPCSLADRVAAELVFSLDEKQGDEKRLRWIAQLEPNTASIVAREWAGILATRASAGTEKASK